jgi:hypothetical protein
MVVRMGSLTKDNILSFIDEFLTFKNRRVRHVTMYQFKKEVLPSLSPVIFLSTGRCGTQWFKQILNTCPDIQPFHNPDPPFIEQSKTGYIYQKKDESYAPLIGELYLAGREKLLRQSYNHGKIFCETNNRITFFSRGIQKKIPNSKFVHLYRNPAAFIRSGISRKWYTGFSPHDIGRIEPLPGDPYFNQWPSMTPLEKIAWLWMETNRFILDFSQHVDPQHFFSYNFDQNSPKLLRNLFHFIGLECGVPGHQKFSTAVNVQQKKTMPAYAEWSDDEKKAMIRIVGETASRLGYNYGTP